MPALKPQPIHYLRAALCVATLWSTSPLHGAQDPGDLLRLPAFPTLPEAAHAPSPLEPPPFSPNPETLPPASSPSPFSPFSPLSPQSLDLQNPLAFPSDSDSALSLSLSPEEDPENPLDPLEDASDPTLNPPSRRNTNPHFWESAVPAGTAASLPSLQQLTEVSALQIEGPLHLRLQLNSALIADDNITLDAKNKKKDILLSLGPAASASLGNDDTPFKLALSYAGAAVAFVKHSGQQSYDQIANVIGSWNGQKLRISFRGGAQSAHTTSNDPGDRIGRTLFYGGIHIAYAIGEKLSSEWSADATHAAFQSLLHSNEYRTQSFLQYQWTPKIRVGLGNTFGVLVPEKGEHQTYIQGLLRTQYAPTAKITLDTQVGADIRRYRNGRDQSSTPVFSLVASWAATPKTQISLEGRRRIFASSALESQNYRVTGVSATLQHLLSESLSTGITTGYENASYAATRSGITSDRRDNYGFLRLSINWMAYRRLSLGSFYELSRNLSTGSQSREFTRNRVGITANLNF